MSLGRIFSGIQPTGVPHLGNYLGAIKNWVQLQHAAKKQDDVMFCVVDLHSSTTCHDPNLMKDNIFNMVASLLACGIDPKRSLLFQQSQVPYHTELAWFLGCLASTGQLKRMHQWKSKKSKDRDENNVGLFSYPVLMAADILLYKSTHVPVGEDQIQHIELTRDLTELFNKLYTHTFPTPQAILTHTPRVMSLRNPIEKMSKSNPNVNSRIDITDHPDLIAAKIKKAVSDSHDYITEDLSNRPGVRNLVEIFSACTQLSITQVLTKYDGVQYFTRQLKDDVTDVVIETFKPIRSEFLKLIEDKVYLEEILREGSVQANIIAAETMSEVHCKVGMR